MQAIVTKYLGPTNYRGSRVVARCEAGSVTLSWACELNADENHIAAAKALATKLGWYGQWTEGTLPRKGTAYCNVYVLSAGRQFGIDGFQVPKAEPEFLQSALNRESSPHK